jgi:HSP20 family protein
MSRIEFDWMREVQDFSNRMKNYFENFDRPTSGAETESGFSPAMDLLLIEGAYRADIEVPGMQKEDILITMAGNAIEVSGEKKAARPDGARVLQGGRKVGSFRKRIELPGDADVDLQRISASYENGVLRITLPKREKDPGVSIPIA